MLREVKLLPRRKIADARGWFLKAITGTEEGLPARTGEVYCTCGTRGQSKGGHWHPKAREWFTPICGKTEAVLADVKTGERMTIALDADAPATLFVPPGVAHVFRNAGDDSFILLAYTDELYDPADTIAFKF